MMKTVLVADDSTIIQKSIDISLSHSDVNVVYTSSASEAWEQSQHQHVDLFILDVSMPDKNGLELCKELKSLSQYAQTPIIMLASAQNPLNQSDLERIGAQDFILKPFETSEVSEKVHGYLNHLSSPPTRDEESFFTPKYSPEKNDTSTDNSNQKSSNSSYDIGFSSVDDSALTDAEVNIKTIMEDNTSGTSVNSSQQPEISDFAFDNSELSGININSNLDSIASSSTSNPEHDSENNASSESTDINFDHEVIETSADSYQAEETLEHNVQPSSIPSSEAQKVEPTVTAAPIKTNIVEQQAQTTEVYPSNHPDLENIDNDSAFSSNATSDQSQGAKLELSDQQIESIVTKVFENVIERIAWEVVPDIAEKMIREEISRLTKD
ncbi:response regulator [bacterium]|nr:response regulator [bacterium]